KAVPFHTVHINGLVRDEQGQKMSKSRGNVIDPLQIIDEYGTDAMRFTLAVMAVPGTDIPFSISRMTGYRAFCNKIWNACRFLLLNLDQEEPVSEQEVDQLRQRKQLNLGERWILSRLQKVIAETNENLENFRFHEASNNLYHFFWHEFCDWFIELAKIGFTSENLEERRTMGRIMAYVLESCLRLLHPFIPFITEELWQELPHSGKSVMVAPYPEDHQEWTDPASEKEMEELQDLVIAIRTSRSENNIDPRKKIPLQLACKPEYQNFLESQLHPIKNLAQLKEVVFVSNLETGGLRVQGVSRIADFVLVLDEVIDLGADRTRLSQQIDRSTANVQQLQNKLQNVNFVQKAPEHVVVGVRRRHQEAVEQLKKLQEKLDGLSQP
ncbi:MAG: class I tRNA ligase family protein, partial [Acidobacteriota bacterium]